MVPKKCTIEGKLDRIKNEPLYQAWVSFYDMRTILFFTNTQKVFTFIFIFTSFHFNFIEKKYWTNLEIRKKVFFQWLLDKRLVEQPKLSHYQIHNRRPANYRHTLGALLGLDYLLGFICISLCRCKNPSKSEKYLPSHFQ